MLFFVFAPLLLWWSCTLFARFFRFHFGRQSQRIVARPFHRALRSHSLNQRAGRPPFPYPSPTSSTHPSTPFTNGSGPGGRGCGHSSASGGAPGCANASESESRPGGPHRRTGRRAGHRRHIGPPRRSGRRARRRSRRRRLLCATTGDLTNRMSESVKPAIPTTIEQRAKTYRSPRGRARTRRRRRRRRRSHRRRSPRGRGCWCLWGVV